MSKDTGCHSWMKKVALCLCLWLLSANSLAWWQAAPAPQEPWRHQIPTGRDFPGMPLPGAERVTHSLRFALHPRSFSHLRLYSAPRNRKSTGLYRVPGEPVTVRMHALGTDLHALPIEQVPWLVIGAHKQMPLTDQERASGAARAMAWLHLLNEEQRDRDAASGLIYIDASTAGHQAFDITIAGAVRAPWFKLGRDSLAQWRETLRHQPAPWAELEGQRAILTLPSSLIRDLDDPEPIIRFYDQLVQDAHAIVGLSDDAAQACDLAPDLPVRFVLDPALSLPGAQHVAARAGYPITLSPTFYGDPDLWLQPEDPRVRAIVLHELGHNLEPADELLEPPGADEAFADLVQYGWQSRAGYWFLGTRSQWPDVQGDLLYAYFPLAGYVHFFFDSFFRDDEYRYDSRIWVPGPTVSRTQKRAFILNLVRHLSYEWIAALYSKVRQMPQEALPDKDNPQQKSDFFFEQLCELARQDLTLYFVKWQVPVSAEAYERVADKGYDVPAWLRHDGL